MYKDQHDKSCHKDGGNPCEAVNKSDHTSAEVNREVVEDRPLSHTSKSSSRESFADKGYIPDNAKREEWYPSARPLEQKSSVQLHPHSWTIS